MSSDYVRGLVDSLNIWFFVVTLLGFLASWADSRDTQTHKHSTWPSRNQLVAQQSPVNPFAHTFWKAIIHMYMYIYTCIFMYLSTHIYMNTSKEIIMACPVFPRGGLRQLQAFPARGAHVVLRDSEGAQKANVESLSLFQWVEWRNRRQKPLGWC